VVYRSSLVIDHLSELCDSNPRVAIARLYCDYHDQEEQSPANMMGSLVEQLVMVLPEIPDEIHKIFQESRRQRKNLECEDASRMLMQALQSFSRVYICIDECEREYRRSLLRSLNQLLRDSTRTHFKLFLTSQPQIGNNLSECLVIGFRVPDPVQIKADKDDVMNYLSYKISEDHDPSAMNEDLRGEIVNTIADGSEGMYVSQTTNNPDPLYEKLTDFELHVDSCFLHCKFKWCWKKPP
jgi:hypothetical protein